MECRLNGVVKELIRTIRVCRRQLLFLSVLGDKESLGESSESSEWFALISFFFFLFHQDWVSYVSCGCLWQYSHVNIFQAARETGALKEAKDKLEKRVEELTWRLQLEKRLRVMIILQFLKLVIHSKWIVFICHLSIHSKVILFFL